MTVLFQFTYIEVGLLGMCIINLLNIATFLFRMAYQFTFLQCLRVPLFCT